MKIRYNAPVTLSFALISAAILITAQLTPWDLAIRFFAVPGRAEASFKNFSLYPRLFSHVLGHVNWQHFLGNFSFILLLGPILEEKYRSWPLLFMMLVTALITGLVNSLFLTTGLMGASGIVFMMILLISFTNFKSGEIPLTFILILLLYLVKEILQAFQNNSISELAHVLGGTCGSLFGFLSVQRENTKTAPLPPPETEVS